jgi:hypothetical protein
MRDCKVRHWSLESSSSSGDRNLSEKKRQTEREGNETERNRASATARDSVLVTLRSGVT